MLDNRLLNIVPLNLCVREFEVLPLHYSRLSGLDVLIIIAFLCCIVFPCSPANKCWFLLVIALFGLVLSILFISTQLIWCK